MPRGIFAISWSEPIKGTLGIDMSASYMNRADRGHRSNIGIEKRGTDDRGNQMSVAVASDRRSVAVGNSESWHALLLGPQNRFNRVPETLTEANRHQHILRS